MRGSPWGVKRTICYGLAGISRALQEIRRNGSWLRRYLLTQPPPSCLCYNDFHEEPPPGTTTMPKIIVLKTLASVVVTLGVWLAAYSVAQAESPRDGGGKFSWQRGLAPFAAEWPEGCLVQTVPVPFAAKKYCQTPQDVLTEFRDPPREFSLMPFWFWNDELTEAELLRQMEDFQAHGVYGFVIHPRIGLPRDTGWMSPKLLRLMKLAIEEARKRKMSVILYDEGMYPSGSASGQVVAHNPAHAERALRKIDLEPGQKFRPKPGWNLIAIVDRPNGQRMAVVDRPTGNTIRGLHYLKEGVHPKEELLPGGDILNPEAMASFRHLVYDRYAAEFGQYFGNTIPAIFTDEPRISGPVPGTAGILKEVNRILGYDFTPYLADLWYHDRPDSARRRADYFRAVSLRVEETYYRPLGQWCAKHGVALAGHPGESMDIGVERYFQIPGQDLVWRMVVPGKKALEGPDSATAKCALSAMIHYGRRRNGNESVWRLWAQSYLRRDAMAGKLVSGSRAQPALPARVLLFGSRPAFRRATARRGPACRLVAEVPALRR